MTVTFYTCSDAPNKVSKTFTSVGSAECRIYEECDMLSPALLLSYNPVYESANYFNCFNRYFSITQLSLLPGGRCVVRGAVDVLASYSNAIMNLDVNVYRTEDPKKRDKMLIDNAFYSQVNTNNTCVNFRKSDGQGGQAAPVFGGSVNYLLTVIGGGGS